MNVIDYYPWTELKQPIMLRPGQRIETDADGDFSWFRTILSPERAERIARKERLDSLLMEILER